MAIIKDVAAITSPDHLFSLLSAYLIGLLKYEIKPREAGRDKTRDSEQKVRSQEPCRLVHRLAATSLIRDGLDGEGVWTRP